MGVMTLTLSNTSISSFVNEYRCSVVAAMMADLQERSLTKQPDALWILERCVPSSLLSVAWQQQNRLPNLQYHGESIDGFLKRYGNTKLVKSVPPEQPCVNIFFQNIEIIAAFYSGAPLLAQRVEVTELSAASDSAAQLEDTASDGAP